MPSSLNKFKRTASFLSVVGSVTALTLTGAGCGSNDPDAASATESGNNNQVSSDTQIPSEVSQATYRDGTYSADGMYTIHKGSEHVNITVTLKDNVITDSQFGATPNFPMSQRFMDMFSQNYKPMVIGKNINEVHLGKVSGASMTPTGFNDALEKIKAQAKM